MTVASDEGPVVYVAAQFPKLSQTFVLGEVTGLRGRGVDVRVLSLRPSGPSAQPTGVDGRVTACPSGLAGALRMAAAAVALLLRLPRPAGRELRRAVRWTLRHRRPDELGRFAQAAWLLPHVPAGTRRLHAHFADGATSVAMTLSGLSGVPFSFTAHARDLFVRTPTALLEEKLQSAFAVVAISEHGRAYLQERCPESAHKVHLVRNGIDLSAFRAPVTAPAPADRPPGAVTVCRLVDKKGVDVLVDAARLLHERGLDVPVEVVGDGPLRGALVTRAAAAGLSGLVTFHGALPPAAVRQRLHRAACFVLPCRVAADGDADGLPVSIVEALAAGLPVVSTPVAGVPEVVSDGVSGLLVPADDPVALAAALERLLSDVPLRRRLGEGAVRVAAAFDAASCVARLDALLSRALAPHRGALEKTG
jgi:glycosyltransferase involved in cell wall biosynthesis